MKLIKNDQDGANDPLDALAAEAAGLDAPPAGEAGPAGPAPPPELSNAQIVAMALEMIRDTLCAFAKVMSPKKTLDEAAVKAVAEAIGPVLDKYGVKLSDVLGDFMLELRAAFVTVPIMLAAFTELREEMRAMKAKPVDQAHDQAAPAPA